MTPVAFIVAMDQARGIGKDNALPWHLKTELQRFKRVTTAASDGKQNAVIMGRHTYESLPASVRPLPGRVNIVLSRQADFGVEGAVVCDSLDAALTHCDADDAIDSAFIIGGGQVYAAALHHPRVTRLVVTKIDARFECDTHMPAFPDRFTVASSELCDDDSVSYHIDIYTSD